MPRTNGKHTELRNKQIDEVYKHILNNHEYLKTKRSKELTRYVMDKFGVKERTAQRIIADARKLISDTAEGEREDIFNKCMERHEMLFEQALGSKDEEGNYTSKPDLKLAKDINMDMAKLAQAFGEKEEHGGALLLKNIDLTKLTDKQLAELKERIRKNSKVKEYLTSLGLL